ncbi:sensor domain-containing diguanylate cyclase [Pseudomonas sp. UBA2684]|uniref:sensor domain-containing diguanylate cyclase n=1 Tax=Pseudomonas sp. UBA2684 TaxID=1947311 RepID=UPI000E884A2B|nr:diguanylate cyclase [Pseudomonas sp. UBA2684]HBX57017.1 sensor domain-containing diguanylate cyclase [Pseudomonas sp.]
MIAVFRALLLVLLPALSQAQVLSLPATDDTLLPGPFMQVWQDPAGRADIDTVRALPATAWQSVGRRDASFGYSGSAYWLRLTLHNPQPRTMNWVMLIGNPLLDHLEAYGLDGDRVYRAGDQHPFDARWIEHRQLLLPVQLAAGENRELILRMQTNGSANLSASLMTAEAFAHTEQRMLLLQGLFFGALAVMIVYNLSIFLITRDRNYLWYSLFVASFSLYQFIQLGFALQWLWPQSLGWHQLSFPLSSAVATLFGILFTYGVLDLRNGPAFYTWIVRLLLGCTLLVIGLALLGPYKVALLGSFALVIACAAFACLFTLLRWRAGYQPARLFAIGWFVLIGASLFSILSGTGLIAYSLMTLHAQQIGGLIELVVFSIALAARIRQAQAAQQQAQARLFVQEHQLRLEQAKSLDLQKQVNEGLEIRVKQRTAALEQALKELSSANRQLSELNRRDSLTGLFNRQTLSEELDRATARAERSRHPLAILMMDLDYFKQVNDQYGHLAGDVCLYHAAQRMQQRLRSGDLLARFGGEEFVAVLSDTDLAGARDLAQQLCADLAQTPCGYEGQSIQLSLSIGISSGIPGAGLDSAQLLRQADQALYRAKGAGRNRVESYEASALDGV